MHLSPLHALPAHPLVSPAIAAGPADAPGRRDAAAWLDPADAEDPFAQADRADRALLQLVGCAAAATLLLALAIRLGV